MEVNMDYERKKVLREVEIETLNEIVGKYKYYQENSSEGISILINGGWGSGKSTFLEDYCNQKDNTNYQFLNIYKSYEYDFYDNAFIPLFSFLENELSLGLDLNSIFSITSKYVFRKILNIPINAIKKMLKDKLDVDIKRVEKELVDLYNEYNYDSSIYDDFLLIKKIKQEIKDKIENKVKNKPLIFIVDELDRCNPRFAIDTLEILKHFMDIKNFIIVIAVDKGQLQESAKTIFGQNMNSDIYFSKFFDYQFNLNRIKFIDAIDFSSIADAPQIIDSVQHIFDFLGISIRDSYKIFNEFLAKYDLFSNKDNPWTPEQCVFILFMLVLKNTDLMFYNSILHNNFKNYYKYIQDSDEIDKRKYLDVFQFSLFGKSSVKACLENLYENFEKKYMDLRFLGKYVDTFGDNHLEKNRKILTEMYFFIPFISTEKTYGETLFTILNN